MLRGEPYKIIEAMKYTETVYYDAVGNEVYRVVNYDDWCYDSEPAQALEDWELEDYYYKEDSDG